MYIALFFVAIILEGFLEYIFQKITKKNKNIPIETPNIKDCNNFVVEYSKAAKQLMCLGIICCGIMSIITIISVIILYIEESINTLSIIGIMTISFLPVFVFGNVLLAKIKRKYHFVDGNKIIITGFFVYREIDLSCVVSYKYQKNIGVNPSAGPDKLVIWANRKIVLTSNFLCFYNAVDLMNRQIESL